MEFVRARVTNYKSIDDSGWVSLDGITCLVGKNESGKSAFLQALRRLNPASGASGDFSLRDYPRKGYTRYRRVHKEQPATVVSAEFTLSDEEAAEIPVLASKTFVVHKDYANNLSWDLKFNQPYPDATARKVVEDDLLEMMPQFVYFDDYSVMRGRISVEDLLERRNGGGELDDADRVFLALLAVAGIEMENLRMHANYEHLKAELESAAIGISDELFEFWKQNKQLQGRLRPLARQPGRPAAAQQRHDPSHPCLERAPQGLGPVRRALPGVRVVLLVPDVLFEPRGGDDERPGAACSMSPAPTFTRWARPTSCAL